jgi:PIN domain nuclease of toxin-antitoxin system
VRIKVGEIAGVADTHTALWFLYDDARLSLAAGYFIEKAAASGFRIAVSSISLAEIVYLIEKKRLPANAYEDLRAALDDSDHVFAEAPFDADIVEAMRRVSRAEVPDMPDRMIAATAAHLSVPVVSRDGHVRASSVRTVW